MVSCVLTGHGQFAAGLASALFMIAGEQSAFDVVTFEEEKAGEFPQKLRTTLEQAAQAGSGVLVFCDLMGGTPFNQAMMCSQDIPGVQVVSGTNLPMLLEVCVSRGEDTSIQELIQTALEAGKVGIDHKELELASSSNDDFDDLFSDDEYAGEGGGI